MKGVTTINSCLLIGYYKNPISSEKLSSFLTAQCKQTQTDFVGFYESRAAHELAMMGTYLSNNDIHVETALQFIQEKDKITNILKSGIDSVCIATRYFNSAAEYCEIVKFCRSINPAVSIIIGGAFINNILTKLSSREMQTICSMIGANVYIMEFEYEDVLLRLLKNNCTPLTCGYTPNIVYVGKKTTTVTASEKRSSDKQVMDYAVNWKKFEHLLLPVTCLRTCISCPYDCAFCTVKNNELDFKLLDISGIIDEMKYLSMMGKTQIINFTDETFNVPPKRFKKLLQQIVKTFSKPMPWFSFIRSEYIDEKTAELMKKSGCKAVMIGVESGCQRLTDEMNKKSEIGKIQESITILKKNGILTFAFYICGYPTETQESVQATIDWINQAQPDFYKVNLWTCEMNTAVWRDREKYKLTYKNGFWSHATMDLNGAVKAIGYMEQEITNSINLGAIDITYVLQLFLNGIAKDQVATCLQIANTMKG